MTNTPREIVAAMLRGAYRVSLDNIGCLVSDAGRQWWAILLSWPASRRWYPAPKPGKAFANPFCRTAPKLVDIHGVWVERTWYVALLRLPCLRVSPNPKGWLRLKWDGGSGVLLGIDRTDATS